MSDSRKNAGGYGPYRELAAAIVQQAVVDLRDAYRRIGFAEDRIKVAEQLTDDGSECSAWTAESRLLRARKAKQKAEDDAFEVESFFYSGWFTHLSDLNGPQLVKDIRAEFFDAESEGR